MVNKASEATDPSETNSRTSTEDVKLDLVELCSSHVQFLQYMHGTGVTQNVNPKSVYRYQHFWLPMVAEYHQQGLSKTESLTPPPDIAWLWHCHRLAPAAYRKFIQQEYKIYGRTNDCRSSILDFNDPVQPYALGCNTFTEDFWGRLYPNEDFLLSSSDGPTNTLLKSVVGGVDLLESSRIQASFLWQVQEVQVQSKSQDEYRRFLQLSKVPRRFKLIPTFEIDLMWHTHMTGVTPAQYHQDCTRICGHFVDHDDKMEDRTPGGELDTSFQKTCDLWKEKYGDDTYAARGGYRGKPPADYFPQTSLPSVKEEVSESRLSSKPTPSPALKTQVLECIFLFFLVIGLAFVVIGFGGIIPKSKEGYVCGTPPSANEIAARGVPVCLQTNVKSGNLCLAAGEDPNDPPAWCYKDTVGWGSYYLWWSPCSKCGTAWRMGSKRMNDKSWYKQPEETRPGPNEMPSDNGWLKWSPQSRGESWRSVTYFEFSECSGSEMTNMDGIPDACYSYIKGPGAILVILSLIHI